MIRILFVCHGNICRSPMAEFVLRKLAEEAGMGDALYIRSAATSTEEIGNPVYPPARRKLSEHGISCQGKRAVQMKRSDYDQYDLIFYMDSWNKRNILRITGGDPKGKIRPLLEDREIDDPWYTGDFETAYREIVEGCQRLLQRLQRGDIA